MALYYRKEMIGEDAVNRALRKCQTPTPRPDTHRSLIDAIRARDAAAPVPTRTCAAPGPTTFRNRTLAKRP